MTTVKTSVEIIPSRDALIGKALPNSQAVSFFLPIHPFFYAFWQVNFRHNLF